MDKKNTIVAVVIIIAIIGAITVLAVLFPRNNQENTRNTDTTTQTHDDDTEHREQPRDQPNEQTSGVTMEQAGKIATDEYGGTIKEVEDDSYHGTPAWEVEIRDSKDGRIEVKVDKKTGEILHKEQD